MFPLICTRSSQELGSKQRCSRKGGAPLASLPCGNELIAPSAVCRCADKSGLLWFAGGKRGDGLLTEFGSVVDAVECALTLQRGMVERNASVPERKRIELALES